MRLLGVELRRLAARRLIGFVLLGGLAAVALVVVGAWFTAQPPTEAQLAEAQTMFEQELEYWEQEGDQMVADCLESEEQESERLGEEVDFGCDQMAPQLEWFLPYAPPLEEIFTSSLASVAFIPVLLMLIIGVTATAAELSTGTMSTWLTFVPRRTRVVLSKIAAPALVALPLTALIMGVVVGGFYGVYAFHGTTGTISAELWTEVAWIAVRTVGLGAAAAAVGSALGVLLRHTAVALGLVFVWSVVVEQILRGTVPRLQPYLLTTNLLAWVQGGTEYWINECRDSADGVFCEGVEHTLSLGAASIYLGVGAAVILVLATLVFRRRDVG
ncbi:ABC transporter permease subunit [Actinotalea sp. BY-33]|uniref:ABC transporter permease subunit n=1 Tax=Actinotalea soli TaxID=2819234 RepID=A0A939LRR7_9CELL|nr:ABC transporter permease subunit [Actinotalea soli]MBO1751455.1 ABC transporter permease subunit [Actinotalea soli]